MNKAVFLDRDGTINVDKHYVYRVAEFQFLPGALNGLKRFKETGYLLIILTNQSGIGRGYYTELDYKVLEGWMLDNMRRAGAEVDGIYYCPHLPNAEVEQYRKVCKCRKPGLGMFYQAIKEHTIDLSKSIVIGDKERDLYICKRYETMQGFLVYTDSICKKSYDNIKYMSGGISQVADYVLKNYTMK